ncbi:TPA: VCBS domain-containing protein, partial [Vibrio vulnificus]
KNYNGQVHFTYDVKDAHSGVTHTGATMILAPQDDAAVIGGKDTGDVTEDHNLASSVSGLAGQLDAYGTLTVTDPDAGQSEFDAKLLANAYHTQLGGRLYINDRGNWGYSIDNSKPIIQQLGQNETLTDTITVHSKDGTTHDIVITIHGDNDAPYVTSEIQLSSGKEDIAQTITSAELLANATDIDHNDQGQLTIANLIADHGSIRDNQDGTYTFTPD